MNAETQYELWLKKAEGDVLEELRDLGGDRKEIERRFGTEQKFGTAGIRCVMGAGSSLLNEYTVRRVARGLARYMLTGGVAASCAIGYDCREHSADFARICAAALAAEGIHVYLYDRLAPTPMLSFAVRQLHCGAGIVISASHNTKEYNGIKCYGPDGCQMTEIPAAAVCEAMAEIDLFQPQTVSFETLLSEGKIEYIAPAVWEAYYEAVLAQGVQTELVKKAGLRVVYSPLCGAGGEPVTEILHRLGAEVFTPEAQKEPSGDFPTCPNPNPENEAAFEENYRLAETAEPDIILATDPDSDRIACALRGEQGFVKLTGNETGCLLLDYLCKAMAAKGTLPRRPVTVMSIVSSPMAAKIAESRGCDVRITPTGFKYIGATILELEAENRPQDFLMGFEESCGYLKGTYCRDKDGVLAAMLIAEMASYYKLQGKTLLTVLKELYDACGYTLCTLQNIVFTTPEIRQRCAAKLDELRTCPPKTVGGRTVLAATDFASGIRTELASGTRETLDFPKETMLRLELEGGDRIILRPSGTEPKMKIYYTAVGNDAADAKATADALRSGMTAWLG